MPVAGAPLHTPSTPSPSPQCGIPEAGGLALFRALGNANGVLRLLSVSNNAMGNKAAAEVGALARVWAVWCVACVACVCGLCARRQLGGAGRCWVCVHMCQRTVMCRNPILTHTHTPYAVATVRGSGLRCGALRHAIQHTCIIVMRAPCVCAQIGFLLRTNTTLEQLFVSWNQIKVRRVWVWGVFVGVGVCECMGVWVYAVVTPRDVTQRPLHVCVACVTPPPPRTPRHLSLRPWPTPTLCTCCLPKQTSP